MYSASVVGGGAYNNATGPGSVVPGGLYNTASGNNSFAAGQHAWARNNGTFVWADSTSTGFESTGDNQFLILATGGVGVGTNAPTTDLHVEGDANITGTLFVPYINTTQICLSGDCQTSWPISAGAYASFWLLSPEITSNASIMGGNVNVSGNLTVWEYVGVGTDAPNRELTVVGDANITGTVYAHNYSGNSDIIFINASGHEVVRITDEGNVGVGTAGPQHRLEVPNDPLRSDLNYSSLFSVDQMALARLEGGVYLGGIGLTENQWGLSDYGNTWTAKDSQRNWTGVAVSSDGRIQTAVALKAQIYVSRASSYTYSKIGIGTDAPNAMLDVIGTVNATGYAVGGKAGITDSSSYWLCTASDCATTCQAEITGGLITGCS